VVPVSLSVRRHLKVTHARDLYWHLAGPREAVLTPHPQRVGGKPAGVGLEKDLESARAEIARLRQKLAARPLRVFNEGASMGASAILRQTVPIDGALGAINERLDRIEDALARMPWARRARRERAPRTKAARPVEVVDAGVLATGEAREQIDAATARLGSVIGFALPPGVVAVEIPEPS
jgi:hypothetical protein